MQPTQVVIPKITKITTSHDTPCQRCRTYPVRDHLAGPGVWHIKSGDKTRPNHLHEVRLAMQPGEVNRCTCPYGKTRRFQEPCTCRHVFTAMCKQAGRSCDYELFSSGDELEPEAAGAIKAPKPTKPERLSRPSLESLYD